LKGAVVFDVGANIGIYSLLAGKKAGQQGHVYSFEPADLAYQRLNKNIRINKFENISVYKQGVSDKNGTTNFYVCEDDAYNSIGSRPMNKVKEVKNIDITSIDEFCIKNNIRRIDVLKIDTEGADLLVLQGAKSVLTSETPPIIFCEFNKNIKSGFNFSLDDYRDFIISMKYRIYEIKNNMLHEFNPVQSNASEILCIHENKIGFYQTLANKK
jgi:FkbM family methyltransferase